MRILVIGGTGFLGRPLVERLRAAGHDLAILTRGARPAAPGLWAIRGDRHRLEECGDALLRFEPEIVIDMILSSGAQAEAVVSLFRGRVRRLVGASSMDVYRAVGVFHGLEPGPLEPLPLTEQSPVRTVHQTYPPDRLRELGRIFGWLDEGYDKLAVEQALGSDPTLPATILRLPLVFGPGDPLHRLGPLLQRMDDRRPAILFDQRVARWRSPRGYVENVAAAIALAATSERATGRTYNVADPDALSEMEWSLALAESAGWEGHFVALPPERVPAHLRVPGNLAQHWVVDSSRIRQELGYAEPVARREAIGRAIQWERAHRAPLADPTVFDYAAEDAALAPGVWSSQNRT